MGGCKCEEERISKSTSKHLRLLEQCLSNFWVSAQDGVFESGGNSSTSKASKNRATNLHKLGEQDSETYMLRNSRSRLMTSIYRETDSEEPTRKTCSLHWPASFLPLATKLVLSYPLVLFLPVCSFFTSMFLPFVLAFSLSHALFALPQTASMHLLCSASQCAWTV